MMNVSVQSRRSSSPLAMYAGRFARRCLLEQLVPAGHPILDVETQLLAEAKRLLREFLMDDPRKRREVESAIRTLATEEALAMTEDSEMQRVVIHAVRTRPFDEDLFPIMN